MKKNKLIPYKGNIFSRISNFLKKIFFRKEEYITERIEDKSFYNNQCKENFIENILIKENEEEKRLNNLQLQYENGEIDEEEISEEDMDKLIEMYEKETEELNKETESIKTHISQMLKELKNS